MNFKKHFRRELLRSYPPAGITEICADIEARYESIHRDISFARTSRNPVDRRLEFCGYFLATIQALEARGEQFEHIREVCVSIAESYVRPANIWQRWLKKLPAILIKTPIVRLVARIMQARTGQKDHPDGFLVRIITSPEETYGVGYGFDILECGICTLYYKHGALKYVPILCEIDRLTSSIAGLELVRDGTIATGAAQCDFRFRILGPRK